jgi:predicted secreted hydrolase
MWMRSARWTTVMLWVIACALMPPTIRAEGPVYAQVQPDRALTFPADHGAHPAFRTEWWYVTGWLRTPDGPRGFQITFFRSRPDVDQANPSAFSPKQIIVAHLALSDPKVGKLMQDQRIARQGFGLASAATGDTDVVLDDWRLVRGADGVYSATASAAAFRLKLQLRPSQPLLIQGDRGYSQKGASPDEASYYYSVPHLAVSGVLTQSGRAVEVSGEAWLDHEWSSSFLAARSAGWDWTGLNLDDGSSLTAFQVRDASGNAAWGGGSFRSASGATVVLHQDDVQFSTQRTWLSARTGNRYPVVQTLTIKLPSGKRQFTLMPLFDDQELDSRPSGGPVYWEGAVKTDQGKGYLELVGYGTAVTL